MFSGELMFIVDCGVFEPDCSSSSRVPGRSGWWLMASPAWFAFGDDSSRVEPRARCRSDTVIRDGSAGPRQDSARSPAHALISFEPKPTARRTPSVTAAAATSMELIAAVERAKTEQVLPDAAEDPSQGRRDRSYRTASNPTACCSAQTFTSHAPSTLPIFWATRQGSPIVDPQPPTRAAGRLNTTHQTVYAA